jgi:hypothetical protein
MTPFIRWLTYLLCALPVAFLWAAGQGAQSHLLQAIALLLLALYAAVWMWCRPARFDVSVQGIELVFPGRRRRIAAASIEAAEVVTGRGFRDRFGHAMRVGVGGLWGGFGWLWTSKGWVEFYVSGSDRFVLVRRHGHMPLLISPQDPEAMAAAVQEQIPRRVESGEA